jgi:hypothetical protein
MARKLKGHQCYNCQECKRLGIKRKAVWRTEGTYKEVMCDEHKHLVKDEIDNGHRTEADCQTWMRL